MMSFYPSSYKFSVIFLSLCWHVVCFGQADTIELDRIKSAIVDAALEQGVSVVSNANNKNSFRQKPNIE